MCSQRDAEDKVRKAKAIAPASRDEARKELLEAAEIYLMLSASGQGGGENEAHLMRAEELFAEAQSLGPAKQAAMPAQLANGAMTSGAQGKKPTDSAFFPVKKPSLTFRDVGGLLALKEEIRFKIIEPLLHPEVYRHYGKKPGGGILMYGPPGCGKSLIAEATAGEAGAAFFHVKPSQIKSKYVGEAERNIAELFKTAREHQPCIIFFDEFETLGADRDDTAANERGAITQLLSETDGLGTKGQQILLLAATNQPWAIDVALRREGRFGTTLFVPPPDVDARKEIFKIHLKHKPLERDIDAAILLASTESYSGADIKAVCEKATDIPLREYFTTRVLRPLRMADFSQALAAHQSIVGQWFMKAERELERQGKQGFFPELASARGEPLLSEA